MARSLAQMDVGVDCDNVYNDSSLVDTSSPLGLCSSLSISMLGSTSSRRSIASKLDEGENSSPLSMRKYVVDMVN